MVLEEQDIIEVSTTLTRQQIIEIPSKVVRNFRVPFKADKIKITLGDLSDDEPKNGFKEDFKQTTNDKSNPVISGVAVDLKMTEVVGDLSQRIIQRVQDKINSNTGEQPSGLSFVHTGLAKIVEETIAGSTVRSREKSTEKKLEGVTEILKAIKNNPDGNNQQVFQTNFPIRVHEKSGSQLRSRSHSLEKLRGKSPEPVQRQGHNRDNGLGLKKQFL
jgi:hypothetical protein